MSVEPRFRHAHPLTAKAQGMMLDLWLGPCGDCENPAEWSDLDGVLARATAAAKDVEEDRDAAERAAEHYRGAIYDALRAKGEGEARDILLRLARPGLGGGAMSGEQLKRHEREQLKGLDEAQWAAEVELERERAERLADQLYDAVARAERLAEAVRWARGRARLHDDVVLAQRLTAVLTADRAEGRR